MKKFLISIVVILSVLLNALGAVGCGGKKAEREVEDLSDLLDTTNLAQKFDESYSAYPRAEGAPEKVIDVLYMDGANLEQLFCAVALQGIVNRETPSLYVVMNFWIEGSLTFDSTAFWLSALDETYKDENGDPYYQKREHALGELADVIAAYRSELEGAVIYDDRLNDKSYLAKREYNDQILGDMAAANLTAMMAGQLDALPMTQGMFASVNGVLASKGAEPLAVVGDTRRFMREGQTLEGELNGRDSLDTWDNCYDYALEKRDSGDWNFSKQITAHNGTLNLACYDYVIGNRMFVFNRQYRAHKGTFQNHATKPNGTPVPTQPTVDRILSYAGDNTPVIGCWNLGDGNGNDEEYCVQEVNDFNKYFLVTVESWNLSWTSGLPRATAESKDEKMTYDSTKVYVSMTFSETDNNSFTNCNLPTIYNNGRRGEQPMSWALNQACVDINPNIISYFNATLPEGDSFATGEAGAGYVSYPRIPDSMKSGFLGLSDLYAGRLGNGNIRTIRCNQLMAMDYIMYMDNVTSVLSGYGGDSGTFGPAGQGTFNYLAGDNNFFFHGKPVFGTIFPDASFSAPGLEGAGAPDILQELNAAPGSFFNIGLMGWTTSLDKIYDAMEKAPDNYVFVTEDQLADLYTQKMSKTFSQVTSAQFAPAMTVDELGFLYYSDNFENYSTTKNDYLKPYRWGKDDNYSIYKFDFAPDAGNAYFNVSVGGDYKISLSADLKNWTVAARHEVESTEWKETSEVFELPAELRGKPVYMKISDSAKEGVGFRFYGASMRSDKSAISSAVTFDTNADGAYYLSGGKVDADGYRTGEVTYSLPVSKNFSGGQIAVEAFGAAEISVSPNGKSFYPCTVSSVDRSAYASAGYGNLYTAYVSGVSENMQIRIKSEAKIKRVHFVGTRAVSEFIFSPCGNDFDLDNLVTGWDVKRETVGKSPYAQTASADVLTYAFKLSADNTFPVLEVFASGRFTLEISADGLNWTSLKTVESGDIVDTALSFDISPHAKANGLFYIRFRTNLAGSAANLYYMKLSDYNKQSD